MIRQCSFFGNRSGINKEEIYLRVFLYIVLSIGAIGMSLPFIWMVSSALKTKTKVFIMPPQWIPNPVQWSNFKEVWDMIPLHYYFINSSIVTGCVVFGQLITCTLAAYAFARIRFPARDTIFLIYLGTLMIPFQITLIPLYILMKHFGWIDTRQALIMPGLVSAYGTFLLRQFFKTIPVELTEAAKLDGCSHIGILFRIVIPLSKAALATLGTFSFIWSWNSFLWPLVVINTEKLKTLPVGLASFQSFVGAFATPWNLVMAGATLSVIPNLILFVFAQRYFVQGITLTGLKI